MKKTKSIDYRVAADEVWAMAAKCRDDGDIELSQHLKEIASELHEVARKLDDENN